MTVVRVASSVYNQVLTVANLAQPVVRFARRTAVVFGVSGVAVWLLWFFPDSGRATMIGLSVIGLMLLMVPAAVQLFFSAALAEFLDLPKHLVATASEGAGHASDATQSLRSTDVAPRPRFLRLGRALYRLANTGFEAKGMVLGAAAAVRLVNPFVLLGVLATGVAGGFLVMIALVGILLRLF